MRQPVSCIIAASVTGSRREGLRIQSPRIGLLRGRNTRKESVAGSGQKSKPTDL